MRKIKITVELPDKFDSLFQLETLIDTEGQRIKQSLFEQELNRLIEQEKQTTSGYEACECCEKKKFIFRGTQPRQLKTVFGEVSFDLPRLRCQSCKKSKSLTTGVLSDLELLPQANITPALRKVALLCGASWPFRQAADVLVELTGVEISHNQIRHLCSAEAEVVQTQQEEAYETVLHKALCETMNALDEYLGIEKSVEGGKEPSNTKRTQKQARPTAGWAKDNRFYISFDGVYIDAVRKKKHIEAKVGIIFNDEIATLHKGHNLLLNKQYVGTFDSSQQFSNELYCCAKEMGISGSTELVILGDGARWINKIAKTQYPKATLILDWWHLKRRVWETADYLKRNLMSEEQAAKWGREVVSFLWWGDTEKALTTIETLCIEKSIDLPKEITKKDLDKRSIPALYHYIKNNQSLIVDYHSYKQNGYFISSVFAEKAIDVLVCRRQKRRGMNWSQRGAENVLTLRKLMLNDQWDSYWQQKKAA